MALQPAPVDGPVHLAVETPFARENPGEIRAKGILLPSARSRGLRVWLTGLLAISWAFLLAERARAEEAPGAAAGPAEKTVVVLVFSGFSPVLVSASATPAFDRLRVEGSWTHRLVAVFPTTSWVNGASLATGCWPEHHGIVADRFIDPELGLFAGGPLRDWWTGCEGLAPLAVRQGVRVTTYGWYGTMPTATTSEDAEGEGAREAIAVETCDRGSPERDAERFRGLVEQVKASATGRAQLVLARFCTPGYQTARYGVDTPEGAAAAERVDAWLGELLDAIDRSDVPESFTLLVTTDHGMRDVSHLIRIERILRREGIAARVEARGSTAQLYLAPGQDAAEVTERLSGYAPFEILKRDELPLYAHWGNGPRLAPLILSAYPPYFVEQKSAWPFWLRALAAIAPDYLWAEYWRAATGGFVPRTPAMYGLVYAWGAGIVAGQEAQAMRVIDIHPTVAHLLGIVPGDPIDGRIANSFFEERIRIEEP